MDDAVGSGGFFKKGLFKGLPVVKSSIWLVFLCTLVVLFPHSIQRQEALGIDFPIFYKAAQNHGEAEGYIYPPLLAWIIHPIVYLPYRLASEIWYVAQACIILILLWRSLPVQIEKNKLKLLCLTIFVIATFRLVVLNAELGQVNGLILLLILLSVEAQSPYVSGGVLGLATAMKLSPALFLPYTLIHQKGRWNRIILYIAIAGLGFIVPWMFGYNFSGIFGLVQLTSGASANVGLFEYIGTFSYFISLLLVAVSLVIAWRARQRSEIWLIPAILLMIVPPVVRKAHFLAGLLLGVLLNAYSDRLMWVAFSWAAGTLGTIVWPPSGIIGNMVALFILLYDLEVSKKDMTI